MIIKIFVLLAIFTLFLLLVWLWFYKIDRPKSENFYKLAEKAFAAGDYKKAKELLLRLPQENLTVEAKMKLGLACLKLREYDGAMGYFSDVLQKTPKNTEALSCLAEIYKAQCKFDEALEIYDKLASDNPKDANSIVNAGEMYLEKGDYDKALELFEKAKKISSDNTKVLFSILKCKTKTVNLEDKTEITKLLDELKKLEGRKDLPSDYNYIVAKTYALEGDVDKSLQYAKSAITADSEAIEGYQLLGLIYLIKLDFDSAKNHLSTALNFQPNNKETHNIFSYVLCHQVDNCPLSQCRENYYKLIKSHLK